MSIKRVKLLRAGVCAVGVPLLPLLVLFIMGVPPGSLVLAQEPEVSAAVPSSEAKVASEVDSPSESSAEGQQTESGASQSLPPARRFPGAFLSGNYPAIPAPPGAVLLEVSADLNADGVLAANLSGKWEFALQRDLEANGLKSAEGIVREEWPASVRHELEVPGCFTAQIPGLHDFEGYGWYRIWLDLKTPEFDPGNPAEVAHNHELPESVSDWDRGWFAPGTNYALDLSGIARESTIFINGMQEREPFLFSYVGNAIFLNSGVVKEGPMAIAIKVGNPLPDVGIPDAEWDGWWNHAGIFRPVHLWGFPHQTLIGPMRTRAILKDRAAGPIAGWTFSVSPVVAEAGNLNFRLRRDDLWLEAELAFPDDDGETSLTFRAHGPLNAEQRGVTFDLPGDLPAWSPDFPGMGEMRLTLKAIDGTIYSRRSMPVGLRDLVLSGSHVLLNGKPLKLFGFSYHEIDPVTGYTFTEERIRADLTKMKELGANFVRTGHYPPHPALPAIASEIGMVVWEEIPAWKTRVENLNDPHVRQRHLVPYLARMILRDINHPSVMFWGIGNEFDSSNPEIRDYILWARDFVRMNDPSRLVVYASDRRLDDVALDMVDIIAINEYYGWYYGEPADLGPVLDELHAQYPNKAILISEFGAGSILGLKERAPGARRDYSELAQAKYLREHLEQIYAPERADWILGAAIWLWADFDDPHRTEKHHPKEWHGVNTKGVVTREGEKKESYYMLKELIPEIFED